MCMYKTVYTVYTCRYTWKLTVKDFILSKIAGLQLTSLPKNVLFHRYFSRKFQFFRKSFVKKCLEWNLLLAMTKYCDLTILKTRDVLVIILFK